MYKRSSKFQQGLRQRGHKLHNAKMESSYVKYFQHRDNSNNQTEVENTQKSTPKIVKYDTQYVYLVRFISKITNEKFLKIGISRYNINARFQTDMKYFDIYLLTESEAYYPKDAYYIEQSLHKVFKKYKYLPIQKLSSGNTECFEYSEDTVSLMKELITKFDPLDIKEFESKEIEIGNILERFELIELDQKFNNLHNEINKPKIFFRDKIKLSSTEKHIELIKILKPEKIKKKKYKKIPFLK